MNFSHLLRSGTGSKPTFAGQSLSPQDQFSPGLNDDPWSEFADAPEGTAPEAVKERTPVQNQQSGDQQRRMRPPQQPAPPPETIPPQQDFQLRAPTPEGASSVEATAIDPILRDYTDTISRMINSGVPREEIYAYMAEYPHLEAKGIEEALAYRDEHGTAQEIGVYLDDSARPIEEELVDPDDKLSFMTGVADSMFLGAADEIDAGIDASVNSLNNLIGLGDGQDWDDRYYDRLQGNRQLIRAADEHDPVATNVGRVAGAVATPIPLTGWRAGAGVARNTGRLMAEGAAYGGAYGFNSGGDFGDRLESGATGAALGAATGLATAPIAGKLATRQKRTPGKPLAGEEVLAAADRLNARHSGNIRPLPGHVSRGGTAALGTALLEPTVLGGSVSGLKTANRRFAQSVEETNHAVADAVAGGPARRLGEAVEEALDDQRTGTLATFADEMEARATAAYADAAQKANGARLRTPRTIDQIDRLLADWREVPGGVADMRALEELREQLATGRFNDGSHTIDGLRQLRTSFGDRLDTNSRSVRRVAKQLWPTLSKDITHGLNKAGLSPAARAYRAADRQYAADIESKALVERILGKGFATDPQRVLDRMMSMSQKDSQQLAHVLDKLDSQVAGQLRGGIVQQLGLARSSKATEQVEFSLETFTTKWLDMPDSAKKALFRPEVLRDLDDLATLTMANRQMLQLGNPSRSGTLLENYRELGVFGRVAGGAAFQGSVAAVSPPTAIGTLAGMPITGALLAQPRLARAMVWMAKTGDSSRLSRVVKAGLKRANPRRQPGLVRDLLGLQQAIEKTPSISTGDATEPAERAVAPVAESIDQDWSEFADAPNEEWNEPDEFNVATQAPDGTLYDPETGEVLDY